MKEDDYLPFPERCRFDCQDLRELEPAPLSTTAGALLWDIKDQKLCREARRPKSLSISKLTLDLKEHLKDLVYKAATGEMAPELT